MTGQRSRVLRRLSNMSTGVVSVGWARLSIVVLGMIYQRKDWIRSDGKTVKPHDLEVNLEDGNKRRNEQIERKSKTDVRECVRVR